MTSNQLQVEDSRRLTDLSRVDVGAVVSEDGAVVLTLRNRGPEPVTLLVPDGEPDRGIEWYAPGEARLDRATPRVVWSGWRTDSTQYARSSRPGTSDRAQLEITLLAGATHVAKVNVAAPLRALLGGRGELCTRAWLIGGLLPVGSSSVCWR